MARLSARRAKGQKRACTVAYYWYNVVPLAYSYWVQPWIIGILGSSGVWFMGYRKDCERHQKSYGMCMLPHSLQLFKARILRVYSIGDWHFYIHHPVMATYMVFSLAKNPQVRPKPPMPNVL